VDELLREINEINAVANLRADYSKTMALLRALKAGRVSLDDVTLEGDGWQVTAAGPPATEADPEQAEPGA
jgi:ribosomal protein L12E/L44/L45/RPP1/RPP2